MRTLSISGTSLQPSVIGLGTATFGADISSEDSFRMLDSFAAAGGTFLDTAHVYASWLPDGEGKSERTLGQWLKKSGARMIISTKGGHPNLARMTDSRLSPACLAQDINESLERLQLDSIDLYFVHRDDPAIPVGEILDALQGPLKDGRIRAIGASNWSPARLLTAEQDSRSRKITGFCCSQSAWSLAEPNPAMQGNLGMFCVDADALRFYREVQFPLIAYSAQAQGFFARSWDEVDATNQTPKLQSLRTNYYSPKNVDRWKRACELAKKYGCSPSDIALAYVTNQNFPTVALIGPRSLDQLQLSLVDANLKLSPEEIRFLEA